MTSDSMSRRARLRISRACVIILAATCGGAGAVIGTPPPAPADEFFIVSSVDAGKSTLVLKRPTEVTLTMRVTEKTRCRDEGGRPIRFTDLRAGDTIFVASERDSSGQPVASAIRKGPMTVEELRRRSLRF
jgi:hypothetical protein